MLRFVDAAIFRTVLFHRMEISMCYSCIIVWAITVFIEGSGKTQLIPAKFPFDTTRGYGFGITFVYQLIAVSFSAFTHMTMDTLATGLFFHAASQVNRLGNKLAHVCSLISMHLILAENIFIKLIINSL